MSEEQITREVSRFYDIVWTKYLPQIDEQVAFLKKHIGAGRIKGKTVLDAGCGTGAAAVAFALLGARKVVGLDISEGALKTARMLAKKHRVKVEFRKESLLRLEMRERFDIVHSFGVLHHTADCRLAFDNLAARVAPGGRFYVALYLKTPLTFLQQAARRTLRLFPQRLWIGLSKLIRRLLVRGSKQAKRGFGDEGDMLDWFFVPHRTHHTPEEVAGWFREHKMESRLLIARTGRYASTSNFLMVGWR